MKNTMANAIIEAAVKRFWNFVKEVKEDGGDRDLNFWIRWTGKATEVSIIDPLTVYLICKYEDKTITPEDLENYFDSQNIQHISDYNYDNGKVYTISVEVGIPKGYFPIFVE